MRGINHQPLVGYISLMEQLRICTIGTLYKSPRWPVWVVASDSHLTVVFSSERRLVEPEAAATIGRRVFQSFEETAGSGFILTTKLQEVLQKLDLVSESE